MNKHTPESWRWLTDRALVRDHGSRRVVLTGCHFECSSKDGILVPFDPKSPDGRLIAAAPDLLEALKGILDVSSIYIIDDPRTEKWTAAYSAIMKAEGES